MFIIRTGRKYKLLACALLLYALAALPSAAAQNTVTGTVDAIIDGESRSWYIMVLEVGDTRQSTATWSDDFGATFSIQAHPEQRFSVEGALAIEFWALEFPSNCPCVFPEASVVLWSTSSMFDDVYQDYEATVTLTSIEPIGDGVYAVEGSFSGQLVFQAALGEDPDPSNALEVEGTFSIANLPRQELLD